MAANVKLASGFPQNYKSESPLCVSSDVRLDLAPSAPVRIGAGIWGRAAWMRIALSGRKAMRRILERLYANWQCLVWSERGQDMTEYALLVALIALVCITGSLHVGRAVDRAFDNIRDAVRNF